MVEPARLFARLASVAGQPTFAYRFSNVASSLRTDAKGALHATEIPFVFETVYFASAGPAAKADPWKARLDLLEKFASPLRPASTRRPSPLPPRRP